MHAVPSEDFPARYATEYFVERRERHELSAEVLPGRFADRSIELGREPAMEAAFRRWRSLAILPDISLHEREIEQ